MTKSIYKYPLKITDTQIVETPQGARFLDAQMQGSDLCLWALVDPDQPKQNRYIHIVGTGHQISGKYLTYIGTAQAGPLVWHVFERE